MITFKSVKFHDIHVQCKVKVISEWKKIFEKISIALRIWDPRFRCKQADVRVEHVTVLKSHTMWRERTRINMVDKRKHSRPTEQGFEYAGAAVFPRIPFPSIRNHGTCSRIFGRSGTLKNIVSNTPQISGHWLVINVNLAATFWNGIHYYYTCCGIFLITLQGNDDAFYVCDIGIIMDKYDYICKLLPRVRPYYGEICYLLLPKVVKGVYFDVSVWLPIAIVHNSIESNLMPE
jgi:hypothetical protein